METVLIAGIDTVVGANLAATLAERHRIIGLTTKTPVTIAGCRTALCRNYDRQTVRQWITSEQPDRIIYCSAAAQSNWDIDHSSISHSSEMGAVQNWARFATEFHKHFTMISSDAVFTGPWVFHVEDCHSICPSETAQAIRKLERTARELCATSLIVRTNAFGWIPSSAGTGWVERTLSSLEDERTTSSLDHTRHATPILATHLAEILELALQNDLTGTYHIAGAERVNPLQFVDRLADHFEIEATSAVSSGSLTERPTGFGRGETSLDTRKIRAEIAVAMPMLDDGIEELFKQRDNGYCERLNAAPLREKVA